MCAAALQDFDPASLYVAVNLEAVERVRMYGRLQPQRHTREHRACDGFDHRDEIVTGQRTLHDSPQVELVRLADVQPVDCIATVRETRARDQHVCVARRRNHAQRPRNHRGGLRAQEQLRRQITCVARVA
jgi:hypothetical protein